MTYTPIASASAEPAAFALALAASLGVSAAAATAACACRDGGDGNDHDAVVSDRLSEDPTHADDILRLVHDVLEPHARTLPAVRGGVAAMVIATAAITSSAKGQPRTWPMLRLRPARLPGVDPVESDNAPVDRGIVRIKCATEAPDCFLQSPHIASWRSEKHR